jgi:NAD(P)-dependent dehydrogenase (short-subunit alcohol dehydrogenase family)
VTTEGRKALVAALQSSSDRLDVLINNAGAQCEVPLEEFPEDGWDDVYDVNVKAPFFLIQALLPLLRAGADADGPARVINIGSINGLHVTPRDQFAYASSKAAVHHLTRHLAAKLAPSSVTVNAIAVGMFVTGMKRGSVAEDRDPAALTAVPLRRFGSPSDIAGAAIYLASGAGSYVTGAVIPVDGGAATTV